MTIEEIQRKIDETPPEVWKKLANGLDAKQKAMDDLCASGDHQGTLHRPTFSGNDIWWECSRCMRRVLQVGGNLPMTI